MLSQASAIQIIVCPLPFYRDHETDYRFTDDTVDKLRTSNFTPNEYLLMED